MCADPHAIEYFSVVTFTERPHKIMYDREGNLKRSKLRMHHNSGKRSKSIEIKTTVVYREIHSKILILTMHIFFSNRSGVCGKIMSKELTPWSRFHLERLIVRI